MAATPGSRPCAFQFFFYLSFTSEDLTPLADLTGSREERSQLVGEVVFPIVDSTINESGSRAALTTDMAANPGNRVHDLDHSITEPATEFTCDPLIVYKDSQTGRDVLPEENYAHVLQEGTINDALRSELDRRRLKKCQTGHVDRP